MSAMDRHIIVDENELRDRDAKIRDLRAELERVTEERNAAIRGWDDSHKQHSADAAHDAHKIYFLEKERRELRELLATAHRKVAYVVRDYPDDKESRKWIEDCNEFMRKSWEVDKC